MSSVPEINFIACDRLRQLFNECKNDINKRILILDLRKANEFNTSHLCLDSRNNVEAIRRKMRVINFDPDTVKTCSTNQICYMLNEDDLNIFKKRKDATDVILIDNNTDDLKKLCDPKSKVARMINALTKFDNTVEEMIVVPVHVLKGGFNEWLIKYPHFSINANYNATPKPPLQPTIQPTIQPSIQPVIRPTTLPSTSPPRQETSGDTTKLEATVEESKVEQLQNFELNETVKENSVVAVVKPTPPPPPPTITYASTVRDGKPKIDRNLKPAFNVELVNAIKAQLNFGRSPEAAGRTITGLQNLGNTCFMNSVIQCLAYAPQITSYFCSEIYYNQLNFHTKDGTNGELAVEFGALVEKLNSHIYRYIEPKSFKESVIKHIGMGNCEQQDSHEFMMMLFDKLHHDLNINARFKLKESFISNGTKDDNDNSINVPRAMLGFQFWRRHLELNKSVISETFEGIFMSTLTCGVCESQSNTFEVFNCLSLPIPSETRCHVRDCLSYFSRSEQIEAAWDCSRCKQKRNATKKIVICKLPKILIIHLKRFSLEGRWRQKLQTTVDFPLNDLTVDHFNVLPQSAYGASQGSTKNSYNLYAVVNHYGHLDGGHYTAYCKLEDRFNQKWYKFDDSTVSDIDESDVCAQSAYILFYILNN